MRQKVRGLPSLAGRYRLMRRLMVARLVVTAALLPVLTYGLSLVGADGNVVEGAATFNLSSLAVNVLFFIAAVSAGVVYLRWLHLAVRTAQALGEDVGQTPGWAVAWWFVPVANLWKPYQLIRTLLQRVGGESVVQSSPLGTWWALWVLLLMVDNAENRASFRAGDVTSSRELVLGLISAVLALAAGSACLRVMARVQSALESRVSELDVQAEAPVAASVPAQANQHR